MITLPNDVDDDNQDHDDDGDDDDDDDDGTFTRVAGAGEAPEILGAMVAVYWGLVALLDKAADDDDDGDDDD